MGKKKALEEIEGNTELIKKAQKLVNSHYDANKAEILGEKSKPIKGLEEFKDELKKHIEIDKMSDEQIYEIAQKLIVKTIKKGLRKH